jgi:hypothetical protein
VAGGPPTVRPPREGQQTAWARSRAWSLPAASWSQDAIKELNAWGRELSRPIEFVDLDLDEAADVGVNKALQVQVYAGAQNQFDEQALCTVFRTLPWAYPGEAVLIVYPEDGPPRIVRGDGWAMEFVAVATLVGLVIYNLPHAQGRNPPRAHYVREYDRSTGHVRA